MIPIIGLDRDEIKKFMSGQMLDLREAGANLKLIFLDARGTKRLKANDTGSGDDLVKSVWIRKRGGRRTKYREDSAGNGISKAKKGTRRVFPLEFKKKIVQRVKDGEKIQDISNKEGIVRSVIDGWIKGRGMKK